MIDFESPDATFISRFTLLVPDDMVPGVNGHAGLTTVLSARPKRPLLD